MEEGRKKRKEKKNLRHSVVGSAAVKRVTEFGQEMKTKAQKKQNAHTRTAAAVYWYSEGHVVLFGFLKRNHAKT